MQNPIDDYLNELDWRVKENSNANYSFAGLQGHLANTDIVAWALENMYKGEIGVAHDDGFIHVHDLSHGLIGYCGGWSTEQLIKEGFNCDTRFVYSRPPRHLSSLFGQMNNFLFTLSMEWAGAQAFNSVDTYAAGFIKNDNMTDDEIRDQIESFIYNLNVKTRVAMQSPFTNFSFDITVPEDLKYTKVWIGDEQVDFTYGDCQEEVYRFNHIFAEVMTKGDGAGKPFTFPIVTYAITPDFPWGSDIAKSIFTFADEANSPYFSNFINSDQKPDEIRSMCPLTPDTKVHVRIDNIVSDVPIADLEGKEFESYFNGKYRKSRVIKAEEQSVVIITDEKGNKTEMGVNHQQTVIKESGLETVSAKDISVGDYLVYNEHGTYYPYKVAAVEYKNQNRNDLLCVEVLA